MKKSFEQSRSVWMDTTEELLLSQLAEKTSADVCVVGAGVAGITIAICQ
jgi:ribulose 1,5-bisphosphate synthetase/thiazole synthase